MFFNQKNEWNQDVKLNFETSEFWVVPIPKFALVRIIVHQLKKLNLKICMIFTQEFDFCFQIFISLALRNLIFETSEAPLSSILKNWQKSIFFHECLPKGLTNFGRWKLKLHALNYHTWVFIFHTKWYVWIWNVQINHLFKSLQRIFCRLIFARMIQDIWHSIS